MEGLTSKKECSQCIGQTKKGSRCKLRTCQGNYCYNHAMTNMGLRVMTSEIPNAGKGLFATKEFEKGEMVAPYHFGPCYTKQEFHTKYPGDVLAAYAFCSGNSCSNPYKTNMGFARFANHKPNKDTNVRFVSQSGTNKCHTIRIVASKKIKGTRKQPKEIYVNYGDEYWGAP
jgi:hypothetical protein